MNESHRYGQELREYRLQLESVTESLKASPGSPDLLELREELQDLIDLIQQQAREESGRVEADRVFKVGDTVLATWKSGDGNLYPARVTSITGSLHQPVYTVSFLRWATTSETLRPSELRGMSDAKKRQAEMDSQRPHTSSPRPSTTNNTKTHRPRPVQPHLSSSVAGHASSDNKKPRKAKAPDELDTGKSKWQKFAQKGVKRYVNLAPAPVSNSSGRIGKAHVIGENSMFRSPEEISGRVGVVGSGKGMRKEQFSREKHRFQPSTP